MEKIPLDVIKYIALPHTKKYAAIIQALPICTKLVQTNSFFKNLLSNNINALKDLIVKSNEYDTSGNTPLLNAIHTNDISKIKYLIENGADIEKPDKSRWNTPLYFSVTQNNIKAAELLLKNGAKVDHHDHHCAWAPFFFAIKNDYLDIAALLIKYGADVNKSNHYFRRTPLHTAVSFNKIKTIEFLLKNKAQKNIPDNAGMTPIQITTDPQIISLLEKHEEI